MIGTILAVGTVVGTVVPWILDSAEQIENDREAKADYLIRTGAGAAARAPGKVKKVETSLFVEVPPDPALGGAPVLMTPEEAVWWMEASQKPEEHVAEIRGILQQQEKRRQYMQNAA